MSWQLLVGLSLLLSSLNGLFHKVVMRDEKSDPYTQTIVFYGLVGIFAFIIALFRGGFHYHIAPDQIPYFILLTIFATIAPVLAFKAVKLIDASENSILFSSERLWIVIGAFIFLHEGFSVEKLVGTIIILLGIGVAQWKKEKFVINLGVLFSLLAAFSYSIAELTSYSILRNFDAISFTVYVSLLPVLVLLLIKPKSIQKLGFYKKPHYAMNIAFVSISDTLTTLLLFIAYQVGRNASQIAPIMATQTILTVILAILILKERKNMVKKIIGSIIVVLGVLLVV